MWWLAFSALLAVVGCAFGRRRVQVLMPRREVSRNSRENLTESPDMSNQAGHLRRRRLQESSSPSSKQQQQQYSEQGRRRKNVARFIDADAVSYTDYTPIEAREVKAAYNGLADNPAFFKGGEIESDFDGSKHGRLGESWTGTSNRISSVAESRANGHLDRPIHASRTSTSLNAGFNDQDASRQVEDSERTSMQRIAHPRGAFRSSRKRATLDTERGEDATADDSTKRARTGRDVAGVRLNGSSETLNAPSRIPGKRKLALSSLVDARGRESPDDDRDSTTSDGRARRRRKHLKPEKASPVRDEDVDMGDSELSMKSQTDDKPARRPSLRANGPSGITKTLGSTASPSRKQQHALEKIVGAIARESSPRKLSQQSSLLSPITGATPSPVALATSLPSSANTADRFKRRLMYTQQAVASLRDAPLSDRVFRTSQFAPPARRTPTGRVRSTPVSTPIVTRPPLDLGSDSSLSDSDDEEELLRREREADERATRLLARGLGESAARTQREETTSKRRNDALVFMQEQQEKKRQAAAGVDPSPAPSAAASAPATTATAAATTTPLPQLALPKPGEAAKPSTTAGAGLKFGALSSGASLSSAAQPSASAVGTSGAGGLLKFGANPPSQPTITGSASAGNSQLGTKPAGSIQLPSAPLQFGATGATPKPSATAVAGSQGAATNSVLSQGGFAMPQKPSGVQQFGSTSQTVAHNSGTSTASVNSAMPMQFGAPKPSSAALQFPGSVAAAAAAAPKAGTGLMQPSSNPMPLTFGAPSAAPKAAVPKMPSSQTPLAFGQSAAQVSAVGQSASHPPALGQLPSQSASSVGSFGIQPMGRQGTNAGNTGASATPFQFGNAAPGAVNASKNPVQNMQFNGAGQTSSSSSFSAASGFNLNAGRGGGPASQSGMQLNTAANAGAPGSHGMQFGAAPGTGGALSSMQPGMQFGAAANSGAPPSAQSGMQFGGTTNGGRGMQAGLQSGTFGTQASNAGGMQFSGASFGAFSGAAASQGVSQTVPKSNAAGFVFGSNPASTGPQNGPTQGGSGFAFGQQTAASPFNAASSGQPVFGVGVAPQGRRTVTPRRTTRK